jgi:hypothetical protein
LHDIEISGFARENYVNMRLLAFEDHLEFSVSGTTKISGTADLGMIQRISAHCKRAS